MFGFLPPSTFQTAFKSRKAEKPEASHRFEPQQSPSWRARMQWNLLGKQTNIILVLQY